MKKMLLLLVAILTSGLVHAVEPDDYKYYSSEGMGGNEREAICDALEQIVGQAYGVAIKGTMQSSLNEVSASVSSGTNTMDSSAILSSFSKVIATYAEGKVRGYEVLSKSNNGEIWMVKVSAKVPKTYKRGLDPNARRRMVVLPFRALPLPATDVLPGVEHLGERFDELLNKGLTQSRRFTMLDRKNDAAVDTELWRLNDENASPDDRTRLGQKLNTDYIVVGLLRPTVENATPSSGFAGVGKANGKIALEVSYRVLLGPTGQEKWANSFNITDELIDNDVDVTSSESMLRELSKVAARTITRDMVGNIYPIRVQGKTGAEIVLSQGGDIKPGEMMTVYREGDVMKDADSGEYKGKIETEVATVMITRVDAKASYAKVVKGDLEAIPVGSIVRFHAFGGTNKAEHRRGTEFETGSGAGVKPPWTR